MKSVLNHLRKVSISSCISEIALKTPERFDECPSCSNTNKFAAYFSTGTCWYSSLNSSSRKEDEFTSRFCSCMLICFDLKFSDALRPHLNCAKTIHNSPQEGTVASLRRGLWLVAIPANRVIALNLSLLRLSCSTDTLSVCTKRGFRHCTSN